MPSRSRRSTRTSSGDEEGGEVRIAGRLMAIRGHGKASFCTLNDRTGNIQVYFKIDVLGEDKYKNQFKKLDIGDIVGIRASSSRRIAAR